MFTTVHKPDPYDLGRGPTLRQVKAMFLARRIEEHLKIHAPTSLSAKTITLWLDQFGALTKAELKDFVRRMNMAHGGIGR